MIYRSLIGERRYVFVTIKNVFSLLCYYVLARQSSYGIKRIKRMIGFSVMLIALIRQYSAAVAVLQIHEKQIKIN